LAERLHSIVVVGGDAAAASVAAGIANSLRGSDIKISLIDEPDDYTGFSSSLPETVDYHRHMALNEPSLVKATGATYKLGYEYTDWVRLDHRFAVATGEYGVTIRLVPFHQYITKDHLAGIESRYADYSLAAAAMRAGRFSPPSADPDDISSSYRYGLNLDHKRYAMAMAQIASGFGVSHHRSSVVSVTRDPASGFVQSVALENGNSVAGDLFVDCSGAKALLIDGALGIGIEDWSQYLPCDRSISFSHTDAYDLHPVTRIIGKQHGWLRRVQLLDKSRFEYCYNSGLSTDDEVVDSLLRDLPGASDVLPARQIQRGARRECWSANVVAMGRAAADFESLESSSLTRTHHSIVRLLSLLPDRDCAPAIAEEFNRITNQEHEHLRELLCMFYALSKRRDSRFWRHCHELSRPPLLDTRLELFRSHGRLRLRHNEPCTHDYMIAVLFGLECLPTGHDPLVDAANPSAVQSRMLAMREKITDLVASMPRHEQYLKSILQPVVQ